MLEGSRAFGRVLTQIKVFFGCEIWKAIWCGEKFIFLAFFSFNSIVKK
jgi:hypothetical protein